MGTNRSTMVKDNSERRERTHDLSIIQGLSRNEVVDRITDEFDVKPDTVRDDLRRMNEWVGNLIETDSTGESRIRELREARGRLYDMALEAREAGDADLERKIVRDIVDSIATDIELCQSLGLTVAVDGALEQQIALPAGVDADDPISGLAERDPAARTPSQ